MSTGKLTFLQSFREGVNGVSGLQYSNSITVSPEASNVYASGPQEAKIAEFGRDGMTGQLTFLAAQDDGLNHSTHIESLLLSPNGVHLYGVGLDGISGEPAVPIFSRDAQSGALSLLQEEQQGVGGVIVPVFASLAVSPDGHYVYAAGYPSGTFPPQSSSDIPPGVVFGRDQQSGQLTVMQTLTDFDFVGNAVVVSPDSQGANVYVAGYDLISGDSSVIVYARDSTTGKLTFGEKLTDGVGGVNGIAVPTSIAISPNGTSVYVTGNTENALAVFQRDTATGNLTFLEAER